MRNQTGYLASFLTPLRRQWCRTSTSLHDGSTAPLTNFWQFFCAENFCSKFLTWLACAHTTVKTNEKSASIVVLLTLASRCKCVFQRLNVSSGSSLTRKLKEFLFRTGRRNKTGWKFSTNHWLKYVLTPQKESKETGNRDTVPNTRHWNSRNRGTQWSNTTIINTVYWKRSQLYTICDSILT